MVQFLQAAFIYGIASNQVIAENPGGPNAELGTPFRVDPVPDRDDGVEVVELNLAFDLSPSLFLNCCKKCNGSKRGYPGGCSRDRVLQSGRHPICWLPGQFQTRYPIPHLGDSNTQRSSFTWLYAQRKAAPRKGFGRDRAGRRSAKPDIESERLGHRRRASGLGSRSAVHPRVAVAASI